MVLRKSFYIRWSAGRSPRVHEVNPGRDPSEIWRKLVMDRLSKQFQKKSENQKQKRALNTYSHRLNRKGYANFEQEVVSHTSFQLYILFFFILRLVGENLIL